MTKSFETWEYEEVENRFGLKRIKKHPLLEEWISTPQKIKETQELFLKLIQERLIDNADAWNEDELKMFFIAPLLSQIPLEFADFKPFTQRTLTAKFPEMDLEITGKVEFLMAKGKQRPKQPYFFLHEYKQERKRENDPLGQLLIAMVAAQHNNEIKMPLYGCYVIGRDWYFVILHQKEYSVSLSFDGTKPELYQIHAILSAMPELITPYLGLPVG
jgi:hypothetical protein